MTPPRDCVGNQAVSRSSALAQALPRGKRDIRGHSCIMRIEITGDDSISPQARTYAEYRLFAALSQVVDTEQVVSASLVLRRAKNARDGDKVVCTVCVELHGGEVARLRASGEHPYAAINRAVERVRLSAWPGRHDPLRRQVAAAE